MTPEQPSEDQEVNITCCFPPFNCVGDIITWPILNSGEKNNQLTLLQLVSTAKGNIWGAILIAHAVAVLGQALEYVDSGAGNPDIGFIQSISG